MKASIQSQIKPHTSVNTHEFNTLPVSEQTQATSPPSPNKTSFKDLLTQSNNEIKEERQAKKAGDYSNLSEEDFLKRLQDESKPKRSPKNKLNKDDFLKLFVAQLQHQDPLSPDNGAEMASKLAQFNSLEQQVNTNKNLNKLIEAQSTQENRQLISYIGNDIKLEGGRIKVQQGLSQNIKFEMPVNAATVSVTVRDNKGVKVAQQDIGSLSKGSHELSWDGKELSGKPVGNGIYQFQISGKSVDGQNIEVPISTPTKIIGVDLGDTDKSLYTTYGKVSIDQISAIGKTGFLNTENEPQPTGSKNQRPEIPKNPPKTPHPPLIQETKPQDSQLEKRSENPEKKEPPKNPLPKGISNQK